MYYQRSIPLQWFQGTTFNPQTLFKENKTVCGFNLNQFKDYPQLLREGVSDLFRLHSEGKIKPLLDETFAFEEVSPMNIINTGKFACLDVWSVLS